MAGEAWKELGSATFADALNKDAYASYLEDVRQRGLGDAQSYDDWVRTNSQGWGLPEGADLSKYKIVTSSSDGSNWGGQLNHSVYSDAGDQVYSNTFRNGGRWSAGDVGLLAAAMFGGGALLSNALGGAAAAGGGAAGGGAAGVTGGALAGEGGLAAIAPEAIGTITPGVTAGELAALAQPLPGAVGGSSWLSAAGTGALKGAGMGALKGVATGQDVLKSALQGAVGGAVGGAVTGFNPASSLGVQSATGQGLINGAISGGVRSGLSGGNVLQGALTGGVSGGVNALNPGSAVFDSKQGQGLINSLVSGAVLGRNPSQLAQQAVGGAVGMVGSKVGDLMSTLGGSGVGELQAFDSPGQYDPDALNKGKTMDDEGSDYDWDSWDKAVDDYLQTRGGADDPDNRDAGGGFWSAQDMDPANAPDNRDIGDGSTGAALPGTGSSGGGWFDSVLKGLGLGGSGGVTGSGKAGSTIFGSGSVLSSLFSGVQGKDVLGMLGSGVNAAMVERQMQQNRAFQKELQDRQWAREDKLAEERRARMKPVSGTGLINAQISTIPGTAARLGG
jgi:hypothetical protein